MRLTRKDDFYPEHYTTKELATELDCIDKLGQLEDLMEEYEISDTSNLKYLLKDYDASALFTVCIMEFVNSKGLYEEFTKFVDEFKEKYL